MNLKNYLTGFGISVLFIAVFLSTFSAGHFGDDTLSSLMRPVLALQEQSFLDGYIALIKKILPHRLEILPIQSGVWYLAGSEPLGMKLYVVALLGLLVTVLYLGVSTLVSCRTTALFSVLSFICLVQFREYGDPILAFFGKTPFSLLVALMAFYCFLRYVTNQKIRWLSIGSVFYVISVMMYEYNIAIAPFLFLILWAKSSLKLSQMLSKFLPLILFTLAYIGLTVYFRYTAVGLSNAEIQHHSGYVISTNVSGIFITFLKSTFAALPFSYFSLISFKEFSLNEIMFIASSATGGALFVVAMVLLCAVLWRERQSIKPSLEEKHQYSPVLYLAGVLFIVPSLLIAFSPKYQGELIWGNAYTSILYATVGLSIFFGTLVGFIRRRNNATVMRVGLFVVYGILVLSFSVNFFSNRVTIEKLNQFWKYPRSIASEALKKGLFNNIESNPVVISGSNYPWSIAPFYYQYAGVKVDQKFYQAANGMLFADPWFADPWFADPRGVENSLSQRATTSEDYGSLADQFPYLKSKITAVKGDVFIMEFNGNKAYYFDYRSDSNSSGYAWLCRLKYLVASNEHINSALCDQLKVYVREPERLASRKHRYLLLAIRNTPSDASRLKILSQEKFKTSRIDRVSSLYEIDYSDNGILIDAKKVLPVTIKHELEGSLSLDFDGTVKLEPEREFTTLFHEVIGVQLGERTLNLDSIPTFKKLSIKIRYSLGEERNTFQPEFAHIIGNHPGRGFDGFVFQKLHMSKDEYVISYGDGTKWIAVGSVTIADENIHVLEIDINENGVHVKHDGAIIGASVAQYSQSPMPLQLGGLASGGRYFDGKIYELYIGGSP
jgi:hypothetical protein